MLVNLYDFIFLDLIDLRYQLTFANRINLIQLFIILSFQLFPDYSQPDQKGYSIKLNLTFLP